MDKIGRVVAWLPIKEHSSRVPRKNFLKLISPEYPNGEHLFERIIRIVHSCVYVDEIIVDTDSQQIKSFVEGSSGSVAFKERKGYSAMHPKITVIDRDPSMMEATASNGLAHTRKRLVDAGLEVDVWVHTHACAPMLNASTIEKALRLLATHSNIDSVVASRPVPGYWFWQDGKPLYDVKDFARTQEWPHNMIRETNTLYVIKDSALLYTQMKVGVRPFFMDVSEREALDVNSVEDLEGFSVEAG